MYYGQIACLSVRLYSVGLRREIHPIPEYGADLDLCISFHDEQFRLFARDTYTYLEFSAINLPLTAAQATDFEPGYSPNLPRFRCIPSNGTFLISHEKGVLEVDDFDKLWIRANATDVTSPAMHFEIRCLVGSAYQSVSWEELLKIARSKVHNGPPLDLAVDGPPMNMGFRGLANRSNREEVPGRIANLASLLAPATDKDLAGINQCLFGNPVLLENPRVSVSLMFWIQPYQSESLALLVCKAPDVDFFWRICISPEACVGIEVCNKDGVCSRYAGTAVSRQVWHHVVVTLESDRCGLFLDGRSFVFHLSHVQLPRPWTHGGLTLGADVSGKSVLKVTSEVLTLAQCQKEFELACKLDPQLTLAPESGRSVVDEVFGSVCLLEKPMQTLRTLNRGRSGGQSTFLLQFWFKPESKEFTKGLGALGGAYTDSLAWKMFCDDGELRVHVPQGEVKITIAELRSGSTRVADGVWHHVAVSCDGNQMSLFLNSHPMGQVTLSDRIPDFDFFQIGGGLPVVDTVIGQFQTVFPSPDGRLFALLRAWDQTITICDSRGRSVQSISIPQDPDTTTNSSDAPAPELIWSPDGAFLYTANSDAKVFAWDVKTAKMVFSYDTGRTEYAKQLTLSPDGRLLACRTGRYTKRQDNFVVLDAGSGKVKKSFSETKRLSGVNYSQDHPGEDLGTPWGLRFVAPVGHGAQGRPLGILSAWDEFRIVYLDGTFADRFKNGYGNSQVPISLGNTPQAVVPIVGDEWILGAPYSALDTGRRATEYRGAAVSSPDGGTLLATPALDRFRVHIYDLHSHLHARGGTTFSTAAPGVFRSSLIDIEHEVKCMAFSADGKRFAIARTDSTLRVWETETLRLTDTRRLPADARSIHFSSDGFVVLCEDNGAHFIVNPKPFTGRIAKESFSNELPVVKTNETLATVLRAKLDQDILRTATGSAFPLEFLLLNEQRQPILFLGDTPRGLFLEMTNVGKRTVHWPSSDGQIELRFRPGTLANPKEVCLAPDKSTNDQTANFSLTYRAEPDRTDCFVLQLRTGLGNGPEGVLLPGSTVRIGFGKVLADALGNERSTRVQLRYRLRFDEMSPIEGSRVHNLSIQKMDANQLQRSLDDLNKSSGAIGKNVEAHKAKLDSLQQDYDKKKGEIDKEFKDHATTVQKLDDRVTALAHLDKELLTNLGNQLKVVQGSENEKIAALDAKVKIYAEIQTANIESQGIPISVGIDGVGTLLCDGQTPQQITLRISNQTSSALLLKKGANSHDASRFTISWEFWPDRPWGLSTKDHLNQLNVRDLPAGWAAEPIDYTRGRLTVYCTGHELFHGKWNAGPEGSPDLVLTLCNFPCQANPGTALLYVEYANVGPGGNSFGQVPVFVVRSSVQPQARVNNIGQTVIDGGLDLVNQPALRFRNGGPGDASGAEASISVKNKNLVLDSAAGSVNVSKLQLTGDMDASKKNIASVGSLSADRIVAAQGVTYSEGMTPGNLVPRGTIIMWSPQFGGAIPAGWVLCDGSSYDASGKALSKDQKSQASLTTPDLRSRFILGAGSGADAADMSGGYQSHTHQLHTDAKNDCSTGDGGAHQHYWGPNWYPRGLDDGRFAGIDTGGQNTFSTNKVEDHKHSFSVPQLSGKTDNIDNLTPPIENRSPRQEVWSNRPDWYALCFLMKL